jgi:NAD(P)H-hydrate epimerase
MTVREPMPRQEVPVLDANAEALGVQVRELMANAGQAVAQVVQDEVLEGPAVILCGKGNNGGDGYVAARHLAEHRPVTVVTVADPPDRALAREARQALPSSVDVHASPELDEASLEEVSTGAAVLVDALLGAGATGEPRDEVARLVEAQRETEAYRVSVDVPTGAGTRAAFVPDVTVALGRAKEVPRADQGRVLVRDIGIPAKAHTHTGPGEMQLFPLPQRTQHKGQGGFVLVVGGGPYAGAPALSAMAAMRAGADLSVVLTPESVADAVAGFSPNLVARPLEGENLDLDNPKNRTTLNKWLGMVDAVVVGPGLGKMDPVRESVPVVVNRVLDLGLPLVLDADALWAISEDPPSFEGEAVLTPHAGEFNVLTGRAVPGAEEVEGRVKLAREAARDLGATILLKGPTDVIATEQRAKRNETGTATMSTGGTGDVLAGLVAALQAKGADSYEAARVAAYLNGKAGEAATREQHLGMMATDLVDAIPDVLKTHLPDAV